MKPNSKQHYFERVQNNENNQGSSLSYSEDLNNDQVFKVDSWGEDSQNKRSAQNSYEDHRLVGSASQSTASFIPFHISVATYREDEYSIQPPIPQQNLVPGIGEKSVFFLRHHSVYRRKKVVLLSIFILVTVFAIVGTLVLSSESKEGAQVVNEDNSGDSTDEDSRLVELLQSCTGEELEQNLFKIAESITANDIGSEVELSNVELSCFPRTPFQRTNLEIINILELKFLNVNISVIEENALNFNLERFTITNTFVEYFENQLNNVTNFVLESSEIVNYPRMLHTSSLTLSDAINITFTTRTIDFITSSPKRAITMNGFLTDQLVLNLERALSSSTKKIVLSDDTGTFITLNGNFFTHIPGELFGADNFEFVGGLSTWVFAEENWRTVSPLAFSGQENAAQIGVNLIGCPSMESFPIAFSELNVYYLELVNTNIEQFEENDFSVWENLYYVSISTAPITEQCTDVDSFRQIHGIQEEVIIVC
eukprot:snap_masked-scaffold_7-processed-gene-11.37-mRNA-1 protein AED:1.00 eAED:1.00 QI:0/-1/0/0/-1/1/1/0/481